MEIIGKYVRNYGIVSGEKDGKEWQRVSFSIITMDGHSRMVAFTAFGGEKVLQVMSLTPGETILVKFYIESREFNDKVFTECMMVSVSVTRPASFCDGKEVKS